MSQDHTKPAQASSFLLGKKTKYLPFIMWFFPLAFFTYQFILRLWPGIMMQQIMSQFMINASQFGLIAAFYYYGYAGMQIPVALLLDRFGARAMVFSFAILCGLATVAFTYSTNWYMACLSRFLIGAGSAVGFLGVSKVISEWFAAEKYTKMIGLSFSVGLMGAIYGGKPVSLLVASHHWQHVALTLAFTSFIIALGAFLVLRAPHKDDRVSIPSTPFSFTELMTILSKPQIWQLAIANLLMVGALEGFSDVWGVPYLMTSYGIAKDNAAQLVSFVFIGMLFGGPLLAWCSKKIGDYPVIILCGLGMALAFAVLLFTHHYYWWFLAGLFFSIGLMCCYQVIVFAAGARLVVASQLGVTIALLNCINMLGGSFFHTLIGRLMDVFWTGALHEGTKQYGLTAYQYALTIIPIASILGAMIVCLLFRRVMTAPHSHAQ
jgi:MFS family permease